MDDLKNDVARLKQQTENEIKKLNKKRSNDINVDNFHGDFTKLPEFLTQYKIAAEANDWSDRDKAKKFPVYLRDLALEAYQNIPEADRGDFKKVEEQFKINILTDDVTLLYSRKFRTRKQFKDESIAEYAYELKKLAKRAFPELQDVQLDSYLMDQFLEGVRPDMQELLLDKDYKTYTELFKKAQVIEYRRQLMAVPQQQNNYSILKNQNDDFKNEQLSTDNNSDFKQYKEKYDEKSNQYCEHCQKYGHLTIACRRLVNIKINRGNSNYRGNKNNRSDSNYYNNYYNNYNKNDNNDRNYSNDNQRGNNFNFRRNNFRQNRGSYRGNYQRYNSPYNQNNSRSNSPYRYNNNGYRGNNYRSNSPYRGNNNYRRNNYRNNYRNRGSNDFNNRNNQNYVNSNKKQVKSVQFSNENNQYSNNDYDKDNYISQLEEEVQSLKVQDERYNKQNNSSALLDKNKDIDRIFKNCITIIKEKMEKLNKANIEINELRQQIKLKNDNKLNDEVECFDFSQQLDGELYDEYIKPLKKYTNKRYTENKNITTNKIFKFNFTTIICMILIILTLLANTTNAIKAFDCSKPEFGNEYSLFDVEQCPEASPTRLVQSEDTYSIYQETTIATVTVVECKLRSAELILYCGHLSHSSMIKTQVLDMTEELTEEQCRDAGYIGQVKLSPDTIIKVQINSTTRQNVMIKGTVDRTGSCSGESYKIDGQITKNIVVSREYELTVTKYSANFDSQTGVMLTNGYTMCQIGHSSCRTGFSTLIYKYNAPICPLIFLKTVSLTELQGKQSNFMSDEKISPSGYQSFANITKYEKIPEFDTPLVLMSRDDDVLRFIRKEAKIKCNKKVYVTNYDNIYVSKHRIADAQTNIKPVDLRQYYYFNNKIDYVYHRLLNTLETIYHETVKRDCLLHREVLRTKLTIAITNPDIATPLLSAEIGLFGRTVGEVLYTFKCKPVIVTLRQEPDRCTNELPVIFQNQNVFLEPVTRMITKNPTVIKCSRALSPKFQINGQVWISLPEQKPVTVPQTLELPKITELLQFSDIQNIAKKGLYTNKALEEASRYILFPRERARIMTVIARESTRDMQNYPDFELLLSPEHFKKATASYLKMVWGKFLFLGQIFSGFMGVYITLVALKMLIQRVVSTYTLYKIFGVTWRLTLGCCPFLSKLFLIKHCHNIVTKHQTQDEYNLYHTVNGDDNDDRQTINSIESQDILKENLISQIKKRDAETQSCADFCLEERQRPPVKPKPRYKPSAPNNTSESEFNIIKTEETQTLYPHLNCYTLSAITQRNPIINIKIDNIFTDALIDTGASISLLDVKHVDLSNEKLHKSDEKPKSASGHFIQFMVEKSVCYNFMVKR